MCTFYLALQGDKLMENIVTDYEKASYGKLGYKRVQRLRKKGSRRGIEVPYLNFILTKPEKPRVVFWIAAIIGLIMFVGILVGFGFLTKFLIDVFSDLYKDSGGLFQTLADPQVLFASQGLSFIPLLVLILAYLLVAMIGLVPLMILIYCYRFVKYLLYTARCSKEEFAKGGMIKDHIMTYVGILAVATVALIIVFVMVEVQNVKLLVGLIYGGVVVIFGGLLVLTIIEKKKCEEWFKNLDEEKKQNYLAHEKALCQIKLRLHSERRYRNNMFR